MNISFLENKAFVPYEYKFFIKWRKFYRKVQNFRIIQWRAAVITIWSSIRLISNCRKFYCKTGQVLGTSKVLIAKCGNLQLCKYIQVYK